MKPQLIIFDLDGTLIDTIDAYWEFFNFLVREWGLPEVSKEDYRKNLFWKNVSVEIAETAGKEKVEEGMRIYRKDFRNYYEKIKLLSHARETLEKLGKNFKLALQTSTISYATKDILKHFSLDKFFLMTVSFDEVSKPKPDPEGLIKIMEKFSVSKEETVYVGDSPSDMKTAEAAGCQFVGYGPKENFPNNKNIQDLYELCEIFK